MSRLWEMEMAGYEKWKWMATESRMGSQITDPDSPPEIFFDYRIGWKLSMIIPKIGILVSPIMSTVYHYKILMINQLKTYQFNYSSKS